MIIPNKFNKLSNMYLYKLLQRNTCIINTWFKSGMMQIKVEFVLFMCLNFICEGTMNIILVNSSSCLWLKSGLNCYCNNWTVVFGSYIGIAMSVRLSANLSNVLLVQLFLNGWMNNDETLHSCNIQAFKLYKLL